MIRYETEEHGVVYLSPIAYYNVPPCDRWDSGPDDYFGYIEVDFDIVDEHGNELDVNVDDCTFSNMRQAVIQYTEGLSQTFAHEEG